MPISEPKKGIQYELKKLYDEGDSKIRRSIKKDKSGKERHVYYRLKSKMDKKSKIIKPQDIFLGSDNKYRYSKTGNKIRGTKDRILSKLESGYYKEVSMPDIYSKKGIKITEIYKTGDDYRYTKSQNKINIPKDEIKILLKLGRYKKVVPHSLSRPKRGGKKKVVHEITKKEKAADTIREAVIKKQKAAAVKQLSSKIKEEKSDSD